MDLIAAYGALLLAVFLEGELALLGAVIASVHGLMDLRLVALITLVGTAAYEWILFYLARDHGARLLEQRPRLKARVHRYAGTLQRNSLPALFVLRFVYGMGMRTIMPLAFGIGDMPWRRYIVLSLASILLWLAAWTALGWFIGQQMVRWLDERHHYIIWGGLLVLITGIALSRLWRRSKGTPAP